MLSDAIACAMEKGAAADSWEDTAVLDQAAPKGPGAESRRPDRVSPQRGSEATFGGWREQWRQLNAAAMVPVQDDAQELVLAINALRQDEAARGADAAPRPAAAAPTPGAPPPLLAGRDMIDVKKLVHPTPFAGGDPEWPDWRFRFESFMRMLGVGELMQRAAVWPRAIGEDEMDPAENAHSSLIYDVLVQYVGGRAMSVLRAVKGANGAEAWRQIVREYEPKDASRYAAMLCGVMQPRWSGDVHVFELEIRAWEEQLRRYEDATAVRVPDEIRCATVAKYAPAEVKDFLKMVPTDILGDYELLRTRLLTFLQRGRAFGN